MSTIYSIGQMNQLADALEAAGYTPDDVTKLRSQPETLKQFKPVLMGTAEVVVKTHTIDCDAHPYVPDGWSIRKEDQLKSSVSGQLVWSLDKVELHTCPEQEKGTIKGDKLRKKLEGQPVLNANVLDYLLANPQLIPEQWKGKYVFFWGTIYRYSYGFLYVRFLYWRGDGWLWNYRWLGNYFYDYLPAALSCK